MNEVLGGTATTSAASIAESTEVRAKRAIARIAVRVLEGRVVPFLGAGVSYSTGTEVDEVTQFQDHQLPRIFKNLLGALAEHGPSGASKDDWVLDSFHTQLKEKRLGEACELLLAAMPTSEARANVLCDILNIKGFRRLAPARTHRAIAFLAAEGLVSEVITTNYDCAIEHAFAQALGRVFHHDAKPPDSDRCGGLRVAFDQGSYRKHGRGSATRRLRAAEPTLRVHKINGCARRLALSAEHAEQILLTEQQLQDFRQRAWSRDLVRDRLRSTVVVFSGFGNAEPQIRHTVGLVMEEFRPTQGEESRSPRDVENAVFFSGFRPSEPTFHQWQAMHAVANSVGSRRWRDLYVGPEEAKTAFVHASWTGDDLPSDAFWWEVWGRVLHSRLMETFTGPEGPAVRALSTVSRCADALAARARVGLGTHEAPGVLAKALLAWTNDATSTVQFSLWLHAARWPGTTCSRGRYHPLLAHAEVLARIVIVGGCLGALPELREGELRAPRPPWLPGVGPGPLLRMDWPGLSSAVVTATRALGGVEAEFVLAPRGTRPSNAARITARGRSLPISVSELLSTHEHRARTTASTDRLLQHTAAFPTDAFRSQQPGVRRTYNRLG